MVDNIGGQIGSLNSTYCKPIGLEYDKLFSGTEQRGVKCLTPLEVLAPCLGHLTGCSSSHGRRSLGMGMNEISIQRSILEACEQNFNSAYKRFLSATPFLTKNDFLTEEVVCALVLYVNSQTFLAFR